jgi:predicted branched-subunit amino acid permease
MRFEEVRAGAGAVAPMLIGVVPFGLVAGATPAVNGLGLAAAVGFSTIVFAGASQLAAIDVLSDGGSAIVAALAACTINLRMLLYSASLAPHLAREPLLRRLAVAYLLTDQAYAVSITRWTTDGERPERRLPFYFGGGALLWVVWLASTIVGALIGNAVPDDLPLDFAVPLVFLVLLVPAISSRPAAIAAAAGGAAAVAAAEAGLGPLSVMVGAISGIVAGTLAETVAERRRTASSQDGPSGPAGRERRDAEGADQAPPGALP